MICVKAGCHMYSIEFERYMVGDLYETNGTFIFKGRTGASSSEPMRDKINIMCQVGVFWPMGGRLVVILESYGDFSFDGIPLKEAFAPKE